MRVTSALVKTHLSDDPEFQKAVRRLRSKGRDLRTIARDLDAAMETVRRALLKSDSLEHNGRTTAPLRIGHPVAMRGLWRGLEQWQGFADKMKSEKPH